MSKQTTSWMSDRFGEEINLARWGESGVPLLVFATAGGDSEEIERFHLVASVDEALADARVKVYSVDSLAGRSWLVEDNRSGPGANAQNRYDAAIYHEVLPAIRKDCGVAEDDDTFRILTAGASIGAFNALAFLCRHPDVCEAAICMSGTYGLDKFLEGPLTEDWHNSSPLHFIPDLEEEGEHLRMLRERFILLAHGKGRAEDPDESWRIANMLGARGIPNRVDEWGEEWHHDWVTWRDMMPKYLEEVLARASSS